MMAFCTGVSRRLSLVVATLFIVCLAGGTARAQLGTGALTGIVVDNGTKKPLAGVLVSVTSPALQDMQTVFTDDSGLYRLPNLPPGAYYIRFDYEGYAPNEHSEIVVRPDVTLRINAGLAKGSVEEVTVYFKPNVDVGSSTTSTSLDKETLKRVPVSAPGGKGSAARSFESVAELAPGASGDLYGTGLNGASSPENHYAIDGLSVGNPAKGTVGTQLSTEFVEEVNVVNNGYMPEFGRATGGVLNVVTKSGSNEFHGGVFSYFSPGALEGKRALVKQDATPVTYAPSLSYVGDVGLDLGGPVLKDKLWFYVAADVSNTRYNIDRGIHRAMNGTTLNESIYSQNYIADAHTIQGMAKLTWAINADNRLTLQFMGAPTTSGGGGGFNGNTVTSGKYGIDPITGIPEVGGTNSPNGTYGATAHQFVSNPYDAILKWTSSFFNKRMVFNAMSGFHSEYESTRAADGSTALTTSGLGGYYAVVWRRNPTAAPTLGYHSITDFETFPGSAACSASGFDCNVSDYTGGAPRDLSENNLNRYYGTLNASYLANFLGHHLIKVGFDAELTSFKNQKSNRVYKESEDGTLFTDEERFGVLTGPDTVSFIDPLNKKTSSLTVGGFVQDSWAIFDKVTLNLGFRYDAQYYYNTSGSVGLSLPNQWSPRIGLIYDPTQSGRAKIFVNYARYYENAPLGFADVVVQGEPQVHGGHLLMGAGGATCNPNVFSQQKSPTNCQSQQVLTANTDSPPSSPNNIYSSGGSPNTLDPNIKASSTDEFSAGGEYEVFADARVGVSLTRRTLNRWIEDMTPRVGLPGFAGNPGYGLGSSFPKAERNYHAATLYLVKSFTRSWLAQASYTLASLRGNYSGLFAPEDFYLGPNGTADFDGPNVENNRYGALPGDVRHTFKILASRDWRFLGRHSIGTGITFKGRSGGATSLLGADPFTYENESYLVGRGEGTRLPWTFGTDLQVAYRVALVGSTSLAFTVDIFNLLNSQQITALNQVYTTSNVVAVPGYKLSDLPKYAGIDKNPAFGAATGYQAPRVFRFGLRANF
jgi:hypothetical protein